MLDVKMLKVMPPGIVFAEGIIDAWPGSNKIGAKMLHWAAFTVPDLNPRWVIRYMPKTEYIDYNFREIMNKGYKLIDKDKVRKLVPCSDAALKRYL